ncbi:unnamed protein product [Sphagnum troendelagicum]|uniref:O-methyltransferase dimerisation domain-containing protein n=1 Tax=Sphagnum troendelagicum TaxID=128251 RepID=A0ABP0ULZ2_9BRYO
MAVNGSTDHRDTPLRNGIVGEQDVAARDAAMRLATIMAVPAVLKAAIELGVFEILSKVRGASKSLTTKEIASQVLPPDYSGLSVINDAYLASTGQRECCSRIDCDSPEWEFKQ